MNIFKLYGACYASSLHFYIERSILTIRHVPYIKQSHSGCGNYDPSTHVTIKIGSILSSQSRYMICVYVPIARVQEKYVVEDICSIVIRHTQPHQVKSLHTKFVAKFRGRSHN